MGKLDDVSIFPTEKELQNMVKQKHTRIVLRETYKYDTVRRVALKRANSEGCVEEEETGKAACTLCDVLLSCTDGNHVRRHVNETCKKRRKTTVVEPEKGCEAGPGQQKVSIFTKKKMSETQKAHLYRAIGNYCVKTGRSYNSLATPEFKSFLKEAFNIASSGYGDEFVEQLPCAKTVQKSALQIASRVLAGASEMIKPYKERGSVHLTIDHGKHIMQHLSIFCSYVDDNFKLRLVPAAFTPCFDGKSAVETSRSIISAMARLGFTEPDLLKCSVTADGASAMIGVGNHFGGYIRCVSHSLNLVGEHTLKPLDNDLKRLDAEAKALIEKANAVIKDCGVVAAAIRANPKVSAMLSRLPTVPCDTRWFTGVKCCSDFYKLSSEILAVNFDLPSSIREIVSRLLGTHLKFGKAVVLVLGPLLEGSDCFQTQKRISLHLVLPYYKGVKKVWQRYIDGIIPEGDHSDECVYALAKSACLAIDRYYEEFTSVHLAATMLYPGTKAMVDFTANEIKSGREHISQFLNATAEPIVKKQELPRTTKPSAIASVMRFVANQSVTNSDVSELERYLAEPLSVKDEPVEDYWTRKRTEFPALFSAAQKIFSVMPSESICETTFSRCAHMLDKSRNRLNPYFVEDVVLGSQLAISFPHLLL